MKRLLVTTGDVNGIGLEISLKALESLQPFNYHIQIVLFYNPSELFFHNQARLEKTNFSFLNNLNELKQKNAGIFLFPQNSSPAQWVIEASQFCLKNDNCHLVTGPLSKTTIQKDGFSAIGHTGLLSSSTGIKDLWMYFLGQSFNVLLVTGHIPLKEVSQSLTLELLESTLHTFLNQIKPSKPIGLLGLNPHSGDKGLIGQEENNLLLSFINKNSSFVQGPLVPDVAFGKSNWSKYSCYFCLYHDQGLIPFKLIHPFTGVHITLGLPFLRVSVDHGVAIDIADQNIANPSSMREALKFAINY